MLYIEELYLKGFRTIQGLKTTLRPGLNIIIGKNGTGKTNFLNFLFQVLNVNNVDLPDFSSSLTYKNKVTNDTWNIDLENATQNEIKSLGFVKTDNLKKKILKNGELIEEKFDLSEANPLALHRVFIKHGLPENYLVADVPFRFSFKSTGYSLAIRKLILDLDTPRFLKGLFIDISFIILETNLNLLADDDTLYKRNLLIALKYIDQLKYPLNKFTNIKDIRINEGFNVLRDVEKQEVILNNLFLEYYVDNQWLTFSSLSDGTKRLFYIISEVAVAPTFAYSNSVIGNKSFEQPVIVLLEEPELGIHPHMLFDLLQFLKESSEDKQIILTTHSPQVLDILNLDELDRILIAKLINGNTSLDHLSEKQKAKAIRFVKSEAYLSDYWKHSDLEE